MKGLNVKRIAALGLGAALIGSALAPAVMAAGSWGNLSTKLTSKSQIIDSTGAPVVDIVVGTIGQPADVIWAGNIAAKVAQMATVPAGGATGALTVNATVGGTVSTAGQGRELDKYFGDSALGTLSAGISDVPSFANGSIKIKHPALNGGSSTDIAVDENVLVQPSYSIQSDADKNLAGQIIAEVDSGKVIYTNSYGSGFPYSTADQTGLDSNAQVDLTIPFMGQKYVVSTIGANGNDLVLYQSTTPTTLNVGDTITIDGAGSYAGQKLSASLDNIYVVGTGTQTFNATWSLKDSTGNIVKQVNVTTAPPYDLKDEFGTSYVLGSVNVSNIAQNVVANKYYALVRTGTQRLEIKNNDVFPYDSTISSSNKLWTATISKDTTNKTITGIVVTNNKAEWLQSDMGNLNAAEGRFGPVGMGGSFNIPGTNYLNFKFIGLESKKMSDVVVGNEQLVVTDTKGIERTIPFIIQLNKGQNNITVGGKDVTVDVNESGEAVRVWNRDVSDVTTVYDTPDSGPISFTDATVTTTSIPIAVSQDWKNSSSGVVNYVIAANESTHKYYLLLKAQKFDVYGTNDAISGASSELNFVGTDQDQNASTAPLGYYLPDKQTYNFVDSSVGLSGNNVSNEGDNYVKEAIFTFNEGSSEGVTSIDNNAYVDTSTGDLINTQDNKNKPFNSNEVTTPTAAVHINENTTAASAKLLGYGTPYGSTLSAASQVLTIMKPAEPRKIQEFVGSPNASTTTTGGETLTGLVVGAPQTTPGGITVNVTAINGAASGPAVSVVPVGTIVKADTDFASGKAIFVGGWLANKAVLDTTVVDSNAGTKLNDLLQNSGDYVDAVLDNGSIVVAGWTASDTASAAQALIAALDKL